MRTVAVFLTFTLVVNVCQAGLWAGIMNMVKRDATEEADVEVEHSLHDHHLEEQAKMGVDNSLDDLTELSKEGTVDNSLDDLTEKSKEGAGDNSLEDDNTLSEASKQVEVEDALSEESLEGDSTLSEESKLSETDNALSEESKLAETDNTLSEEALEAVNSLSEESKLAETDNTLSEESKLAETDNTLSEESKLSETDSTLSEESKLAETDSTLSEESKLAETDNTLSEESKQAETDNTLSEDSLEVVHILPEAAKLVADEKSLSDLVEADKSAEDSDDVSDEARWFLHGTCSCDEHQSPGQQVATCQVDILRPEPEKYSYLGYNNCDQGYVPVCGRIFTVCYCLCKWDYNAETTTATPATSAPHDDHGHE